MRTNKEPNVKEFESERKFRNYLVNLMGKSQIAEETIQHEVDHMAILKKYGGIGLFGVRPWGRYGLNMGLIPYVSIRSEISGEALLELFLAPDNPSLNDKDNFLKSVVDVRRSWVIENHDFKNIDYLNGKQLKILRDRKMLLGKLNKKALEDPMLSSQYKRLCALESPDSFNLTLPNPGDYGDYVSYCDGVNLYNDNLEILAKPYLRNFAFALEHSEWRNTNENPNKSNVTGRQKVSCPSLEEVA